MSILLWFQKFKKEEPKPSSSRTSTPEGEIKTSEPSSFNIENKVVDALSETSKLNEKVSQKLKIFEKAIKDVEELKRDAKKAVEKSETTQNIVYLGFIVLLIMIAGIVFVYCESTFENKEYYDENLKNQINFVNLSSDFQIFKSCLKNGGWNNCFK